MMKRFLSRRSSRAPDNGDKEVNTLNMFSQEKITTTPDIVRPNSISSTWDLSSKGSVSESGTTLSSESKYASALTEQPGLMLANEEIIPTASMDKEVVNESEKTIGNADAKAGTQSKLGEYLKDSRGDDKRGSLPTYVVKPDLLSQELTAPDAMEKEIVVPTRQESSSFSYQPDPRPSATYREYNFYYTNTMAHLIICDPDQQALFFAESSAFTKGKSDIHFHDIARSPDKLAYRGSSLTAKEGQTTPVVATADFVQANNIRIGLGDPLQPESAKWMMMRNVYGDAKQNNEKYEVRTVKPDAASKEVVYQWVKGVAEEDGTRGQCERGGSKETFKMLSEDGVIASFRNASATSLRKRGYLRIFETSIEDDALLLIFVSFVALCEKQKRRMVKKRLLLG